MRLDAQMTAEAITAILRQEAVEAFGEERAAVLERQLDQHAAWLARIAAEPVDLEAEAPDLSGLEEQP